MICWSVIALCACTMFGTISEKATSRKREYIRFIFNSFLKEIALN